MQFSDLTIQPLQLGREGSLFAFRTSPQEVNTRIGAIILNAGLLHSVGPFGLHVDLSTALAGIGIPVVRIDQSGKGESPARTPMDRYSALLLDYDDALESLAELGTERAIVMGLCSGADDGLRIAEQRDSVAGMVMFDGYARKTARYKVQHMSTRLSSPTNISRALTRRTMKMLARENDGERRAGSVDIDIRDWLGDEEMCDLIAGLLSRDARILAVYSRGQNYYNHVGQLAASLRGKVKLNNLQEIFHDSANHTYIVTKQRERLVRDVVAWAKLHFADE